MNNTDRSPLQPEDKFLIRFDEDGDRAMFAALAAQNGRSLNKELVHRLKGSLVVPDDVTKACADLAPVDAIDFAIKLLQRAGLKVSGPNE